MKKLSAAAALLAAAALVLSGCSAAQPDGDTTITFMGWGSPEEIDTFKTMIAQYEEKYPGVTVDYITVADADFATKLQTMIASKKTPDVFYLQPDKLTQYVDAGLLADLSSYVDDNQEFSVDNVWKKALDFYRYDGTTRGTGAIYGLPKDIGPFALAYNKDLFDAAGITAPTDDAPWTWDQFEAAAKTLTQGSGNDKVYGSSPYSLESAVWSNGADWLNADRTKVTVTDPKFVEALQWVADLNLVDHVVPSPEEQSALPDYQRFVDGKVAMMGIGPWNQGGLWNDATFNWDIMPWPVSPSTGTEAIWLGSIGFGVANSSKDKTDAANLAAFMAFNKDAQRTNIEKGQAIPNLIDMAKSDYLTSDKAPANKQEFLRIIEDYGRIATQTTTYDQEWFTLFNSNVASVFKGEKTAAEYTASVQDEMQKLLDEGIAKQGQ
ncbi:MAG: sugar ABC transporter substrate-binding protein [Actinomycetales bacterium]|nr:sugar ABC transporter substrate-binding protein [Actinomycetales bacterium]